MADHTSGPWKCQQRGNAVAIVGQHPQAFRNVTGILVAQVDGPSAPANAKLVAAAPELLDAILQYRSDMQHPVLEDDRRARRLEMIERVIKKATE